MALPKVKRLHMHVGLGIQTWKWLRQSLQNGCLYQCWNGYKKYPWILPEHHFEYPYSTSPGITLTDTLTEHLIIGSQEWSSLGGGRLVHRWRHSMVQLFLSATTNFEMKVSFVSSQISYCCRNCGWSCLYPEWHRGCFHSCLQWWCFVCGFAFLQIWE